MQMPPTDPATIGPIALIALIEAVEEVVKPVELIKVWFPAYSKHVLELPNAIARQNN